MGAEDWSMVDKLNDKLTNLHVPMFCKKCGGRMIFQGVGEYKCELCGFLDDDDYGKIRLCIENFPGVTIADAEMQTGVSQRTIRNLLKEGRIMLTEDSKVMLQCERCGKKIRSGRYCTKCENVMLHEKSSKRQVDLHGYGMRVEEDLKGEKRYKSDEKK